MVSSLLDFAESDQRPQFAAAMRAMQQDYVAASEFKVGTGVYQRLADLW